MENTFYALQSVWTACTSWFTQVKTSTGIPIFEICIAFAALGIIFKLLVFPFLGYESSDLQDDRRHEKWKSRRKR